MRVKSLCHEGFCGFPMPKDFFRVVHGGLDKLNGICNYGGVGLEGTL